MRDLMMRALDTAVTMGASYADVRVVHYRDESVTVRLQNVEGLTSDESLGFGVRVIVDGYWGFSSSNRMTLEEASRVAAEAVRIARASGLVRGPRANLGDPEVHVGTYRTPIQKDPFAVSLEDKIALLLKANEAMQRVPGIVMAESNVYCQRERKWFASTEGSFIEQELVETGCGIEATAVDEGEVQRRSYPNSVGRHQGTEGWEFVERYDLPGNAQRVAEEAVALLTAKPCPSGVTTVILDGSQVALQIHESCGHAIELDRVLGTEAAFAGTSFLTPDKLGTFQYGSEHVNIRIDATSPGGLGTFGYDDEGVPATSMLAVERGRFVNYLMSRETAAALGKRSNGCMRASSWNRIPLIRMTNVSLEPGEWTLEDLIADTDEGIYMETNRSWSIDDRRLNFQFGTEIAREIKNGKLGALLKNATYTGITPQFWNSCDAVCNRDHWVIWGTPNCGKGQPEQVAHTGHGAAPARFRNVQVGVMK
ncbi:MAG TPA: TldD/PmbA family protein [Dehalococcoidia bacterium]|nr:TldD/PmbA family protein [Dehalococcoidia bacterium]